jgi:hypothetical protein
MSEETPLHPFETQAGRAILRDLQGAASAAQWHGAVARLVALLAVSATGWRGRDQALVLWALRVEDFIEAGPQIGGRKPDVVLARQDAQRILYLLGADAPRSAAADLFMREERQRGAAAATDWTVQSKRAREAAEKRVDRAKKLGGASIRARPKRK